MDGLKRIQNSIDSQEVLFQHYRFLVFLRIQERKKLLIYLWYIYIY